METRQMLTSLEAGLLAEAFPERLRVDSTTAAGAVLGRLHRRQWTDRFSVCVENQAVLIPYRLHFAGDGVRERLDAVPRLMARCLETRSSDGFHRQRAVRDVLSEIEPWSVPFVVALIGEYVIEILHDIEAAMSPGLVEAMAAFARANPEYWRLTRQRVTSYWDAYHRAGFRRSDYVGFTLTARVDSALEAAEPG